jgi:hypothetical protein
VTVLFTIDRAVTGLSKAPLVIGVLGCMLIAFVLLPVFDGPKYRQAVLAPMVIAFSSGFVLGVYFKYRAQFGVSGTLWVGTIFWYFFAGLAFGGTAALAAEIAGRADLRWWVFGLHNAIVLLTLLGGINREAHALRLFDPTSRDFWKIKLDEHIDLNRNQIRPSLTTDRTEPWTTSRFRNLMWIIGIGSVNVPLLFELYGGGRNNLIFLAVPLLALTLGYVNLTTFGPALLRLLLVHRLEKATGRPFVNADYEQIQALRRTFFLSRWLMKDYTAPQTQQVKPGEYSPHPNKRRR